MKKHRLFALGSHLQFSIQNPKQLDGGFYELGNFLGVLSIDSDIPKPIQRKIKKILTSDKSLQ